MSKPKIRICGPRDRAPEGVRVINTTSRSRDIGRWLSPFFLGPVKMWDGSLAGCVENAWQFSKVYEDQVGKKGGPTKKWYEWARNGWTSTWAQRYPKGKGAIPLYSYWNRQRLDYIQARKKIYCPLYSSAVWETSAFAWLCAECSSGEIWLWDFDGYDHVKLGMSLRDVLHDKGRKMGHAFVLAMLLRKELEWCKKY